jgi:3-(methylthio)propionyl---CoA ligase
MLGKMMNAPLLISSMLRYAATMYPDVEIVSRRPDQKDYKTTYSGLEARCAQLASALCGLGIKLGDRIATLAWNDFRHLELYYGISGIGAVCHTVNPRLFIDQIVYIINHAEDRYVFFDPTFRELVEKLRPRCPVVEGWVELADADKDGQANEYLNYETLLSRGDKSFPWPSFDENTASGLCYTSGTTGNPKGVLYSHRSSVLHAFAACQTDAFDLKAKDVAASVSPMFHAMSWALPYCATMKGVKQVLPGPRLDGPSLLDLFDQEGVTVANGVPTIWLGFIQHLEATGKEPKTLNRVLVGGSACPRSLIAALERRGIEVLHAWGMTETSPLGTMSRLPPKYDHLDQEKRLDMKAKQGRAAFGVEICIRDGNGTNLPHDGKAFGDLLVRGPWIAAGYFKSEESPLRDGWFFTGDVASIDPDGYMQIVDRSKDVIKSGGEWISSIELENLAMAHPAIAEAAAIGVRHEKWDERPIVIAVPKPGSKVTPEELTQFYQDKIAKWWLPDSVVFVDQLPHTATGKVLKTELRQKYADHLITTR